MPFLAAGVKRGIDVNALYLTGVDGVVPLERDEVVVTFDKQVACVCITGETGLNGEQPVRYFLMMIGKKAGRQSSSRSTVPAAPL